MRSAYYEQLVKLIDTLDKDEKNCLLKMIDIAIAKKKMKENIQNLAALK